MEVGLAETTANVEESRDHGLEVALLWLEWQLCQVNLFTLASLLDEYLHILDACQEI